MDFFFAAAREFDARDVRRGGFFTFFFLRREVVNMPGARAIITRRTDCGV